MLTAALVAAGSSSASVAAWLGRAGGPSRLRAIGGVARPVVRIPANYRPVVLGLVVAWLLSSVVAGLLAGGLVAAARRLHARAARRRDDAVVVAAVPKTLSALAAELRAGHPLAAALTAVADAAPDRIGHLLRSAATAESEGKHPGPVFEGSGDIVTGRVLGPLSAALAIAESGAALAGLLDRLAMSATADGRIRLALRAELAGPQSTALLLAGLPVLGIGLAGAFGSDPIHVLLHTPIGIGCAGLGGVLEALGVAWSRQIVRTAAR